MEGVKILETIVDSKMSSPALWFITVGCLAFAGTMIYDLYNGWKKKHYDYSIGLGFVVVACFFSIVMAWNNNSFEETKYIVSIDDSVNFNEFSKKYEIIEKNGEKYTVREIQSLTQKDKE